MKQITFLHTADLHLDRPFTSLGDEQKANIRRAELENCLKAMLQKVYEKDINILIISGDLFEDSYIRETTVLMLKNLFSELYRTEIIISPGNHDPIGDNSILKTTNWSSNVHILEDSTKPLYLERLNTCIYSMGVKQDVKEDYYTLGALKVRPDAFNVLVFHGTVDIPFEGGNYNCISSEELYKLNMDYIALGHMHCYQQFTDGKTVAINPGSPEPLGFDEEGEHGCVTGSMYIGTDGQKTVETVYIPTATRHYHNIDIDISNCVEDAEVLERINSNMGEYRFTAEGWDPAAAQGSLKSSDLYSLTLTGFISKGYMPDISKLYSIIESKCFFLKIANKTSENFDFDKYLEEPGIKGEFVRRIFDLMEKEADNDRRETLFLALQYGLQALEKERVDK